MKNWLDVAQKLPLGHKTRINCECGDGKTLLVNHGYKAYNAYCFRCGENPFEMKGEQSLTELKRIRELNDEAKKSIYTCELPTDFTNEIPREGRMWLFEAGITESTWRIHNIGYSEEMARVILPVYDASSNLVWFQCRAILAGQQPKYLQPSSGRDNILFESYGRETSDRVIVVEDILSAIRVGKLCKSVSLLGTKISTAQIILLSKYDRITTWLDSDKAGVQGAYRIRKALELVTSTDNIVTELDPKLLSDKQIRRELCLDK